MNAPADLPALTDVIGALPYRMAFAGGWIDQPYISRHDPAPPGSMVVVSLEPTCRYMDRSGMASGTRQVARQLWGDRLPDRDPIALVHELYQAENAGKSEPSGAQDMIGLIVPGISRLDFDIEHEGGFFPRHIETNRDPAIIAWLESVIYMVPVVQRQPGYNPLGVKNTDPAWVRRLGQSGADCYAAILARDTAALGASMNESMWCWEAILPHTVRHSTIPLDLMAVWDYYRAHYPGAMYSGCGGGYLYVVSERPVPGGFQVRIRG